MAAPRLQDGEQVLVSAHPGGWLNAGRYFWTLGLYELWRKATWYVVTDRRVIQTSGLVTRSERSLPLAMIQDVTVTTTLGVGRILLTTAGGPAAVERMYPLTTADACSIQAAIIERCGRPAAAR
jgi:membrane protein YdbS with pleckstrin-like domain